MTPTLHLDPFLSMIWTRRKVWRTPKAKWWMLACGSAVALVTAAALAAHAYRQSLNVQRVSAEVDAAQEKLSAAQAASAMSSGSAPSDFVAHLPASIDLQPILSEIQRRAAEAEVVFAGVQVQQRPASADQLARADLTMSLRGSYPHLKQALAEVLARFPNATLSRLTWRRATTGPNDAEATTVLSLWAAASTAPVAPGKVSAEPGPR